MVIGRQPAWDEDHEFIEGRIHYWIGRLARPLRLSAEDCEDLAQDLRLDLIRRLPAYDASRASRRTFISRVVANHACTLAVARRAAKRDSRRVAYSLDAPADADDPASETHGGLLTEDDLDPQFRVGRAVREARADLKISLSLAGVRMPAPLRRVCDLLGEGYSVTEIACQLEVHRCTVHERKTELRRWLRAAGFDSSPNPPDTPNPTPVHRRYRQKSRPAGRRVRAKKEEA